MHYYIMSILEETESGDPCELKLWRNKDEKIWIQLGYDEMEPNGVHGMVLTPSDAKALVNELYRILEEIEDIDDRQVKIETPKQALKMQDGQLTLSKVDWGK